MDYLPQLGLVALGSRTRALSDRLYALADTLYRERGLDLQGRWFPLLRLLHARGGCTVGEIAEAIGQSHSAVSQIADRLVAQGWLAAEADPDDRRRRRLRLTDTAEAQLRAARPLWRALDAVLHARCAALGIDPLATLAALEQTLDEALPGEVLAQAAQIEREALRIVPFAPDLRDHFYRLNEAWLRRYFYVEEIDHQVLSEPERWILADGGTILFALLDETVVGTCALMRQANGEVELTKMAVEEGRQGLGIGRALIDAAIAEFQRMQAPRLFLETNSKLTPAIRLYESVGFVHQPTVRADSHYARADVYMVWQPPGG